MYVTCDHEHLRRRNSPTINNIKYINNIQKYERKRPNPTMNNEVT